MSTRHPSLSRSSIRAGARGELAAKALSRDLVKRLLRRILEAGQRVGVNATPRHFYSEIPDIAALRTSTSWLAPHTLTDVDGTGTTEQLAFVASCQTHGLAKPHDIYRTACTENGAVGYGPIEAGFLYDLVATKRPPRIIQIGCGVSTAVILMASRAVGYEPEVVCIDPYPTAYLIARAGTNDIELLPQPAQHIAIDLLTDLKAGDLLFIDSTHAVRPDSEVNRVVLEVLPRLRAGILVHFHDITFPYTYSPTILDQDVFFWSETALLLAFLTNNARYTIRAAFSILHHEAPAKLRDLIPEYKPAPFVNGLLAGKGHFPSALYLEVLAPPDRGAHLASTERSRAGKPTSAP